MFSHVFYGNTLENWLISLAYVVGAIILNNIIILVNKKVILKLTSKTSSKIDDIFFKMLEAPVLFGIILISIWIASTRLDLQPKVEHLFKISFKLLIVVNITWFVVRIVNSLIEEYVKPRAQANSYKYIDHSVLPIIRRGVLGAIWAVGIVMALKNAGYNVETLIAGLGIGGLAFALAAQDTIKNIFGGITIFSDRPFKIGDRIKVDGFDGIVEDIGIRSTRIRTLEKRVVTIPNYKIVEASIENITLEPMRKVILTLGLTYDTPPEKMNEALDILKGLPKIIKEIDNKDFLAVFSDFSAYSLDIKFIYWIKKSADVMETPSKINMEILRSFNEAGLNFAFPTQTVVLEQENS